MNSGLQMVAEKNPPIQWWRRQLSVPNQPPLLLKPPPFSEVAAPGAAVVVVVVTGEETPKIKPPPVNVVEEQLGEETTILQILPLKNLTKKARGPLQTSQTMPALVTGLKVALRLTAATP